MLKLKFNNKYYIILVKIIIKNLNKFLFLTYNNFPKKILFI